ncbi:MAG: hypothetical protein ACE5JN_14615 [Candidatus Methylomirabilia bacterium]
MPTPRVTLAEREHLGWHGWQIQQTFLNLVLVAEAGGRVMMWLVWEGVDLIFAYPEFLSTGRQGNPRRRTQCIADDRAEMPARRWS